MAELVWAPGEEDKAIAGIKSVRKDGTGVDWAYVTYAGTTGADSGKLKFGGEGHGTADDLKSHFAADNISFALLRVTDKIDMSVTVKFVWINFVGPKTPRMMQSKLSVQLGAIKQFFQPFSTDHTNNNIDEVSHHVIMEKVLAYSVSGNKVMDSGSAGYRKDAASAGTAKVGSHVSKMADGSVSFDDALRSDVRAIRDEKSENDWVLATYADPSKPHLVLLGKGSGAVAGLKKHLTQDNVVYGLVRKLEKIDDTWAVKFVYIRWIGKNIPFMQRAKLGTHSGDVYELFTPFHNSLDAPEIDDVTDENVMRLIQTASGTYKHVLDEPRAAKVAAASAGGAKPGGSQPAAAKPAAAPKSGATSKPPPPVKEGEDVVTIGAGIREAIASVRQDKSPVHWALVTYDMAGKTQSKSLVLLGTGEGGIAELKGKLADDIVGYALLRTMEKVDDSDTVKFVFIDWRGPKIHRMQRAILGTHSGAVREVFAPYHVDVLDVSKQDEVTEQVIAAKIQKAAGTANYVLS